MNKHLTGTVSLAMAMIVGLLSACAPGPAVGGGPPAAQQQPAKSKVLTLGVQREPSMFHNDLTTASESAGGLSSLKMIPQNYLVIANDRSVWVPQLAAEQISPERGTWRVNPDGTMETTWRLRSNVKWHDGTPFTSADLLFAFTVYKDPEIPNRIGAPLRLMQSASAPDPHTFVVQWSATYVFADRAPGLEPMAKHLLEESYLADKPNFASNPRFRTEFVGLGAYRLVAWEPGSHFEFARFDDYYRGRPPLDRVIARVIPDLNTMIANILSGTIDVMPDLNLDVDLGLEMRQRWAGTDNQVLFVQAGKFRWFEMQHRPELARPVNGLTNRTVRQGLYHAIDREAVADVITVGFGQPADSWFHPNDELRPQLEASIPKYPYNPARAQQLLAQGGWVRGPDGVLVYQPTGERFEIEIRTAESGFSEKLANVARENWQAVGAQVSLYEIPASLRGNNEFRAKFSGVADIAPGMDAFFRQLDSRSNAGPENRWTGNRAGYVNPRVDALTDKLNVAIASAERIAVHRELLQEAMGDVALMPLYWEVKPLLAVRGVKGIRGYEPWNFHEWDKD